MCIRDSTWGDWMLGSSISKCASSTTDECFSMYWNANYEVIKRCNMLVNVHFKLHAPGETTVEATLKDGKVTDLKVLPESREKDIVIMIEKEK